nr:ABC transporter substrate-binding protein [Cyanobacterium sp. IPPAS B-1200]
MVLPEINTVQDLGGKTIAVPFWYSIHNLVLQQMLKQGGLKVITTSGNVTLQDDEVGLVVMPPPEMVSALANKSIAGYNIVAEPFNAASETNNTGKLLRLTGDVWQNHACCVVFLQEDDINNRPEWTQGVVSAIVKSQSWMRQNRGEVAQILSTENGKYTPHPEAVLQKVLTGFDPQFYAQKGAVKHLNWESQRIDFQPYPFPSYTENLITLLKETQVEGETNFLQDLDPKFVATDLVDDTLSKGRSLKLEGLKSLVFLNL